MVTRPRPNAGNQTLVLSPRILGLVQPGGTCLCPEVPRQFLPGLGSLPGRLPRKPHQIPGALNLPGHRMIWGVGCLSYLRFQDSQRTPKVTPWTATRQPPLSMEFSRQEYWSGVCHFLLQERTTKVKGNFWRLLIGFREEEGGWGTVQRVSVCPGSCLPESCSVSAHKLWRKMEPSLSSFLCCWVAVPLRQEGSGVGGREHRLLPHIIPALSMNFTQCQGWPSFQESWV